MKVVIVMESCMFSVFSVFRRNIDVPRAAYSCTIDRIVKVLPVVEHRGVFYDEIGQTKSKVQWYEVK